MSFGQFVIGPPGSGKSTYCNGLQQYLEAIGRPTVVVNLDPANYDFSYRCDIDISDLITLQDVMEQFNLGPNGGLIYCIEFLLANVEWLTNKLATVAKSNYILFDCPGQVELYTHHGGMRDIVHLLRTFGHQLCCVHLVDSHHCSDLPKFVSVLMVSLASMIHLEMPHVNVLSKIDLVERYGTLPFSLEYFCDVIDLEHLLSIMDSDPFYSRFAKLNRAICGLIEDYSQVSFSTLNIQEQHSVEKLLKLVDKANGYIYGPLERKQRENLVMHQVTKASSEYEYSRVMEVQEKYMKTFDPTEEVRPSLPREDAVVVPIPLAPASSDVSQASSADKACWNCLNAVGTLRCSSCKAVYYCSKQCQRVHWQLHKHACKSIHLSEQR